MADHGTRIDFGNIPSNVYMYVGADIDAAMDNYDTEIAALTGKRQETYLGTTDSSGNYTVTFGTAFSATPDVQPQIQPSSQSDTRIVKVTGSSTTGFTVNVRNRTDVVGLLPSYSNVTSASVSVLVTAR